MLVERISKISESRFRFVTARRRWKKNEKNSTSEEIERTKVQKKLQNIDMDHYSRSRSREDSRSRSYEKRNYSSNYDQPSPKRKYENGKSSDWNNTHGEDKHGGYDEGDGALYFTDCVLLPPTSADQASMKEKPPGCKTIYVGKFPEALRHSLQRVEVIMQEVFTTNGGNIENIRSNNRGFCHIRFEKTESVEMAMSVNGYRMVIKQEDGTDLQFRLTVDYSESHGDLEDYEARQVIAKKLQLEECPISTIPPYNMREVEKVQIDLKCDDFQKVEESIIILRYWLNSGAMERQKSDTFFSLLQVSQSQIKHLLDHKEQLRGEFEEIQNRFRERTADLGKMFDHLVRLYEDAKKQKCWDRFTRGQRKSIDSWLTTAKENKPTEKKVFGNKSGGGDGGKEETRNIVVGQSVSITEDKGLQTDITEADQQKNYQIASLEENLQYMRQQVWDMVAKLHMKEEELKTFQEKVAKEKGKGGPAAKKLKTDQDIDDRDLKLSCILCNFLLIHPFGASDSSIYTYLSDCNIKIANEDVITLLNKFPKIFAKKPRMIDDKITDWWTTCLMADPDLG